MRSARRRSSATDDTARHGEPDASAGDQRVHGRRDRRADRPPRRRPGRAATRNRAAVERLLGWGEDVVYVGIAVLLFVSSVVLLVVAADQLLDVLDDFASDPIVEVLDTLLLVFIVVELLSAVRTTLSQRELVAEPFLIVGIIASIKEIVVLSVKAAESIGTGAAFRDQTVGDRRARRRRPPARRDGLAAAAEGAGARRRQRAGVTPREATVVAAWFLAPSSAATRRPRSIGGAAPRRRPTPSATTCAS